METINEFTSLFSSLINADDSYEEFRLQIKQLFMPKKLLYLEFIDLQFNKEDYEEEIDNLLWMVDEGNPTYFVEILEEDEIDGPQFAVNYAHRRWLEDKERDLKYIKRIVPDYINKYKAASSSKVTNSKKSDLNCKQKALIIYLLHKHKWGTLNLIHLDRTGQSAFFSLLLKVDYDNFYVALGSALNESSEIFNVDNLNAIKPIFEKTRLSSVVNEINENLDRLEKRKKN